MPLSYGYCYSDIFYFQDQYNVNVYVEWVIIVRLRVYATLLNLSVLQRGS